MQVTKANTMRLGEVLSFRLSVLSNIVSKQIARQYQDAFGLTMWQWRVMAVIGERDGLSASDIVGATAMDKVAVSRAVTGLIELGHLKRIAAADDGRRAHLHLTAQGRSVYAEIVPLVEAELERCVSSLSARERESLDAIMTKLGQHISPQRPLW